MGFTVTCGNCRASYQVGQQLVGKRVKCPKCQGVIVVTGAPAPPAAAKPVAPAAPAAASPAPTLSAAMPRISREQLLAEIRAATPGPIDSPGLPFYYPLGLLMAVLIMGVLIAVYLAIIALVCYGVYWHAVHDVVILQVARNPRVLIFALAVYITPLLAGPTLIFFLVKPLFTRKGKQIPPVSVTRDGEPVLFEFVESICRAVDAPMPRRIDVDVNVNASASFRHGFASMILGNDLVLTIGLPLVAGMDTRQLAGVLAHEFGHFRQGAGMRLSFLVRSMSFWFTRIVFERDSVDHWLARMSSTENNTVNIAFAFIRVCVWATRWVLWALMYAGHFVAGFLLRQMEFDADRFETLMAGSETFAQTSRQLMSLSIAFQGAIADLRGFYCEGKLGDNLPKLLMHNAQQLPAEVQKKLDEFVAQSKTGVFDTHPCDRDRIAAAKRLNAPGVFRMQRPAILLFASFGTLARQATLAFYREEIGSEFRPEMLHAVDSLLDQKSRDTEAVQALSRHFQGSFSALRPIQLDDAILESLDLAADRDHIAKARAVIAAEKPKYEAALKDFDAADTVLLEVEQASALLDAGFRFSRETFSVPLDSYQKIQTAVHGMRARSNHAVERMRPTESAVASRISRGLRLLDEPNVAAKIANVAALRQEVARLMQAHRLLVDLFPKLLEYRRMGVPMPILAAQLRAHGDKESLLGTIKVRMVKMHDQLGDIFKRLVLAKYPFQYGTADISIADYLLHRLPTDVDLGALMNAYSAIMEKVPALYVKLTSRLSEIAEQVETVIGLPPMTEPTPKTK